jgi:KDO2-lipid IV(A) lauroyltransferase
MIVDKLLIKLGLGILRLFSGLPMPIIDLLGGGLGFLGYHCIRKRRNVGLVNLGLCFPEMSEVDKKKLILQHFKELMRSTLCYGWVFYASPNKLRRLIKIRGLEHYTKIRGKHPVILLAPHFLGLDIGANRLTLETPGYSVYSAQRSAYLNERMKAARLRFIKDQGGEIFSRQEGLRSIVRKMKQTMIPFYYLPDQDMDEKNSLYVPFFAHPVCATLDTLPKLAQLTEALIIPMATYREGNHYVVELAAPLENYPTGDTQADVATMNRYIETMIMKHPDQYLWMHKRFKTQPNLPRGKLYENC